MFDPIANLDISRKGYLSPPPDFFSNEITVVFSTIHSGNMSFNNGDQKEAKNNRQILFQKLDLDLRNLVVIKPNHANQVVWVEKTSTSSPEPLRIETDVLLTSESNLILGLATADCLPVFLHDPTNSIIGLAHAGRKGIELSIFNNTLTRLVEKGCDLTKLKVYFGPGIQRCCYSFPAEPFESEFEEKGWDKFSSISRNKEGKITAYNLDIAARAAWQLLNFTDGSGRKISPMNISASLNCTHCTGLFFSHKRIQKQGKSEQRFLSLIVKIS